ncbi:hypothetical protein EON67_12415 [archaeon]|nr:MAG: hypothetical protein EON67_12415 [archaeon]
MGLSVGVYAVSAWRRAVSHAALRVGALQAMPHHVRGRALLTTATTILSRTHGHKIQLFCLARRVQAESMRHKAAQRAMMLSVRSRSTEYNIDTGACACRHHLPSPSPALPSQLSTRMRVVARAC